MASLISKTVKGHQYWYIVESKRINGKVKQEVIEYIGSQKKLGERLLKSGKENITADFHNLTIKSYRHGDVSALMKIADLVGVENILDRVLKPQTRGGVKRSISLILAAIHRASSPGSKKEFSHWFEGTSLPYQLNINPQVMTSQHFWDQMSGISEADLWNVEDAITKNLLGRYDMGMDKIALDYTNYFTYIDSGNHRCDLAKRGRNKQKRHDLRQCSLAIVTSKELGLPLFSHVYEGNRNDQSEFSTYIKLLSERMPNYNPDEITLVFDGGSNTKENLNSLEMHYICSFSLSYCKELYQIELEDYSDVVLDGVKKVKAYRLTQEIWGRNRECILMFSEALYQGQMNELEKDIEKTLNNLQALNEKIKNPKSRISKTEQDLLKRVRQILRHKYIPHFIQAKIVGEEVVYEIDENKKQELIHCYFGKKLMITDRKEWKSEEIIKSYYEQDCIEKLFRDTKNTEHFSMQPIYHWTDQKIRVHIFICLLGLTLATVLQKELQKEGILLSKNELLEELSEIRECWVKENVEAGKSGKIVRMLEEMNESQKELWSKINKI